MELHTRSWRAASLWYGVIGGYTHLSAGKVFHLHVWCSSTRSNNRRSLRASCQWRGNVLIRECIRRLLPERPAEPHYFIRIFLSRFQDERMSEKVQARCAVTGKTFEILMPVILHLQSWDQLVDMSSVSSILRRSTKRVRDGCGNQADSKERPLASEDALTRGHYLWYLLRDESIISHNKRFPLPVSSSPGSYRGEFTCRAKQWGLTCLETTPTVSTLSPTLLQS